MGKFLRSAWSTLTGAVMVVVGALPVADVVELAKSGEIIGIIITAVGGALMGAGHPAEKPQDPKR